MKSAAYSYGDELLSELNISISGSFTFIGPSGFVKPFLKCVMALSLLRLGPLRSLVRVSDLTRDEMAYLRRKLALSIGLSILDHLNE